MLPTGFWSFTNHLLTEDTEGYDATDALFAVYAQLTDLASHGFTAFEKKTFSTLAEFYGEHHVAPSHTLYMKMMSEKADPADAPYFTEFQIQRESGLIKRFSYTDTFALMDDYIATRNKLLLSNSLSSAMEIANGKLKVNGKELSGTKDAIQFLQGRVAELESADRTLYTSDLATISAEDARLEYDESKANELTGTRLFTGHPEIDDIVTGFQKGELITILGSEGDGKTSICTNWAYNGFLAGLNVAYFTLEMAEKRMRYMFYCLHATNAKFGSRPPISRKVLDNYQLEPDDEDFMFNEVIPDFNTSAGSIRIIEPNEAGFTFDMLKVELERLNAERPLDVFILDYPNLMDIVTERGGDYDQAMNRLYVKLKRICEKFNQGQRLVGIIPTQANRAGRQEAEKNKGAYSLRSIAQHHEISRSSDYCFYIFRDDETKMANECLIGSMKTRNSAHIPQFRASFIGELGLVTSIETGGSGFVPTPGGAVPMPSFSL